MHARIEGRNVRLLTRTGLDWTDKYPAIVSSAHCGECTSSGALVGRHLMRLDQSRKFWRLRRGACQLAATCGVSVIRSIAGLAETCPKITLDNGKPDSLISGRVTGQEGT